MIIVVTGLMRTGTSLAARWLHEMGVTMGTTMRFPLKDQVDWEDVEFTDEMLKSLMGHRSQKQRRRFMLKYIKERGSLLWGVKSPFLLPFVDEFKEVAGDAVRVVLTTRDIEDTFKSLGNQTSQYTVHQIQTALLPSLDKVNPDLVVPIEESWESPEIVKGKLKALIRS